MAENTKEQLLRYVTTPVDKSTGFYGLSTDTLLSQCGSALWLLR